VIKGSERVERARRESSAGGRQSREREFQSDVSQSDRQRWQPPSSGRRQQQKPKWPSGRRRARGGAGARRTGTLSEDSSEGCSAQTGSGGGAVSGLHRRGTRAWSDSEGGLLAARDWPPGTTARR
jgi:hypothetical protein